MSSCPRSQQHTHPSLPKGVAESCQPAQWSASQPLECAGASQSPAGPSAIPAPQGTRPSSAAGPAIAPSASAASLLSAPPVASVPFTLAPQMHCGKAAFAMHPDDVRAGGTGFSLGFSSSTPASCGQMVSGPCMQAHTRTNAMKAACSHKGAGANSVLGWPVLKVTGAMCALPLPLMWRKTTRTPCKQAHRPWRALGAGVYGRKDGGVQVHWRHGRVCRRHTWRRRRRRRRRVLGRHQHAQCLCSLRGTTATTSGRAPIGALQSPHELAAVIGALGTHPQARCSRAESTSEGR